MNDKIRCLLVDDEPMAIDILKTHLSKIKKVNIVGTCNNATEAFNLISIEQIDLIFLDINMPGISGISFAKTINSSIKIIFTTAYREYAVDGFDLHAVDYLLKPISYERLLDAITNYSNVHQKSSSQILENEEALRFIFIRVDRRMVKLIFEDILYIESLSDYLKIHLQNKEVLVVRETITNISEKLPSQEFLRIHRSFIINTSKIDSYNNEEILIEGRSLPLSRSYKEQVLNYLNNFQ
ncbi:DNA-binding response regulator, LytR/AlgR family [Gillisia sp. Hel1_33_143]|uniref:LytR/AlgR family response regulator transcription factor n=1 Tax=Gillisia sp. Hel1_33_143 TaxID=1336796 RepID=UPI00087AC7DB|nr:LytTR family DNA-binding domain-containing protein [Gillisia sp. Hel1_33_143]SDS40717.1 DNA-binding response regulator, LytR/AlgR family [Gillisia sp. Hel1_33_143]